MGRRPKWKFFAVLTAVGLAAGTVLFVRSVPAQWREEDAVHIQAANIDDSTLIIGSHLIYLQSMNEEIYEIAQDSAEESVQDRIYYKSELAEGAWFDITNATTLADITTGGTPVTSDVIEALFLTHHTKPDKKTYDLRTNEPVNLCDIKDPYDLESIDELMPLQQQHELLAEAGNNPVGCGIARGILTMEPTNARTGECDRALAALQAYKDVLADHDAPSDQIEQVQKVMTAIDAARRAQVFTILEEKLNNFLTVLEGFDDPEQEAVVFKEDDSDEEKARKEAEVQRRAEQKEALKEEENTAFIDSVGESLANVGESLTEQEGKMLAEGVTVMSRLQYRYANRLSADALIPNHAACDGDVAALLAMDNITNGIVADPEAELSLLDGELFPMAADQYAGGLQAGENPSYAAEVAKNSSKVVLDSIADANTSDLNTYRSELESYVTARCLRLGNREAQDWVNQLLTQANGYYNRIPNDAFRTGARSTVDKYIEFLTGKLRELVLAAGGNDADRLSAQIEDLQTAYMEALDNNDLLTAAAMESQRDALSGQLDSLLQSQNADLAGKREEASALEQQLEDAKAGGASAGEIARLEEQAAQARTELSTLESSLPDGSAGKMAAELKRECLDLLSKSQMNQDERNTLSSNIEALGGLVEADYATAFPALKEIHGRLTSLRDLNGDSSLQGDIDTIEQFILENQAAYNAALSGGLDSDALLEALDGFFDGTGGTGSGGDAGLDTGAGGGSGSGSGGGTGGGSGTGDGSGSMGGLTVVDALDGAAGLGLDENQQAVVKLMALQRYIEETGSKDALELVNVLSQQQLGLGNPYVFVRVSRTDGEYLPVTAVAAAANLRYVWEREQRQATLARGGTYYEFTVFSSIVRTGGEPEQMPTEAQLLTVLHLPESYTQPTFGVEALYLSGNQLGVAVPEELQDPAEELLGLLLGGA